jgi:hypothetical protein
MRPTVIKGLNFSDVPIDTHPPKGDSIRHNFYSADEVGLFQDQISYVTPPASPQNGLLQPQNRRNSFQNRTPGTVRFHPSVNTRHPAYDEYADNSATEFHWDREEQVKLYASPLNVLRKCHPSPLAVLRKCHASPLAVLRRCHASPLTVLRKCHASPVCLPKCNVPRS